MGRRRGERSGIEGESLAPCGVRKYVSPSFSELRRLDKKMGRVERGNKSKLEGGRREPHYL